MLTVRRAFIYITTVGFIILVTDLTGVHRHFLERNYKTEFSYPVDVPDFPTLVQRYRNNEAISQDPINEVATSLIFMNKADLGCASESYRLILLVKSSPSNFERREAIRQTWGNAKRFSDVHIKTVFLMGFEKDLDNPLSEREEKVETSKLDQAIEKEISKYNDIIQADFHDSQDNTTVKTLMGLRWLTETCTNYRYALIVNDGMYISVKNLLKFVRHPAEYPEYWEIQKLKDEQRLNKATHQIFKRALNIFDKETSFKSKKYKNLLNDLASDGDPKPHEISQQAKAPVVQKPTKVWKNNPIDFQIDMAQDVVLYAGHVLAGPTPRHKLGTKYYLPLDDYQFDQLPPYVSTEAIVLSKQAVLDLYYASFFTKYLKLDDIYLGLCSKKLNNEPFHSNYFKLDPSLVHDPYGKKDFRYVVTANNFDDPQGLIKFWNVQKSLGNA